MLPTLIDLAGIVLPKQVKFDGRSIRPLLDGKANPADGPWPDRILVTDSQRVMDAINRRRSNVMTSRWRPVNGTELYDIKRDPGQENDVARAQPDVVARLRASYERWWANLEPAIYLGHEVQNPARLTSHDWIATDSTPWNQSLVRKALDKPSATG